MTALLSTKSDMHLAQILWDYHQLHHQPQPVDIIFGLGSNELRVASYCAELYKNSIAPLVVFSGYQGNSSKSVFHTTEAKFFADHAIKCGVPESSILIEEKAANTGQNFTFTRQLLCERRIHIERMVVVTKPNTQRRAYATAQKVWSDVKTIVLSPPLTLLTLPTALRTQHDIISEMVGDIQRIKMYPKLGYQIEQSIPPIVWEAYTELRNRGYTDQLIVED